MKRTKTTGQTCIGEIRLCPIDVGFDLRTVGNAITLPAVFSSVGIEEGGDTWLIEGTRPEMIEAIRAAGYAVVDATDAMIIVKQALLTLGAAPEFADGRFVVGAEHWDKLAPAFKALGGTCTSNRGSAKIGGRRGKGGGCGHFSRATLTVRAADGSTCTVTRANDLEA